MDDKLRRNISGLQDALKVMHQAPPSLFVDPFKIEQVKAAQRAEEAAQRQIELLEQSSNSPLKDWLLKPIIVATLSAFLTTLVTVPTTIYITKYLDDKPTPTQPEQLPRQPELKQEKR